MASCTKETAGAPAMCARDHTEPLLTESIIDVGARVAAFVDKHVTLADFVEHIYPERTYNEVVDWDHPGRPYNHMYARYTRLGKHDAASMALHTVESVSAHGHVAILGRGDATDDVQALDALLSHEHGAARFTDAWIFLDRLSSDIGILQCIELTGTEEEGAKAYARFEASGRVGSRFWLGCDGRLKAALLDWRGTPQALSSSSPCILLASIKEQRRRRGSEFLDRLPLEKLLLDEGQKDEDEDDDPEDEDEDHGHDDEEEEEDDGHDDEEDDEPDEEEDHGHDDEEDEDGHEEEDEDEDHGHEDDDEDDDEHEEEDDDEEEDGHDEDDEEEDDGHDEDDERHDDHDDEEQGDDEDDDDEHDEDDEDEDEQESEEDDDDDEHESEDDEDDEHESEEDDDDDDEHESHEEEEEHESDEEDDDEQSESSLLFLWSFLWWRLLRDLALCFFTFLSSQSSSFLWCFFLCCEACFLSSLSSLHLRWSSLARRTCLSACEASDLE
ncbi:hypothetical protein pmac_cds_99 [Pandoravirus macleodensis]|uniref:Uncharacterized protein n=1 Tax=Pandoravirus macleodensis TaxID=2107707 RepID=A0A2U7UEC4_9VIRU|nr:hypothetical protein pmac_cds_99 [Pandoravirus macleodensis]AVK76787.1 hypothetical protein pmac_cds_99 [Pandoravirus macleodensis]